MSSIESNIEAALFARARTLSMTLAWPNDAAPGGIYVAVRHLPNDNVRLFLKGSNPHLRRGILQLNVVGALNVGPSVLTAAAGTVAAHFPADLALYSEGIKVRIAKAPDVASAFKVDASYNVPVSVNYEAFI